MQKVLSLIEQALPITDWLPSYSRADLRGDAVAGLTVGVMLIPQGMAYAVIAGLPPIYGLYASLVPLLIYPLLGTSRHLAVGTVATGSLLVAAGVGRIAEPGTSRYIELAIMLAAMTGIIEVAMSLFRLGFLVNFLSRPVIAGFTAAAAMIIATSQAGPLLGIELSRSQHIQVLVWEVFTHLEQVNLITLALGVGSIALLVLLGRWKERFPSALAVVLLGSALVWGFDLDQHGVTVVGEIPSGLPSPRLPSFSLEAAQQLLPTALTLSLEQFMSVMSLVTVFASRHGYSVEANRELMAIGGANLTGSFFGGYPISGSFSRTTVNERAGARTPLANVVTAGLVALTLLFLTPLFYYLPMAALAAIIVVAAGGLIDFDEVAYLFRTRRREGFIALFTFACTLVIGIQEGILLGIGATMVAVLYRISRPNVAELGHVPGTRLFRDLDRFDQAVRIEGILVLRVDASFSFANAEYFKDFILEKSEREGRDIKVVVIDGTSINDLDTTAIEALHSVIKTLDDWGIDLYFTGLIGPVREVVVRAGLFDRLGADHFHMGPHDAVVHVLQKWDEEDDGDRVPRYFAKTEKKTKPTPAGS